MRRLARLRKIRIRWRPSEPTVRGLLGAATIAALTLIALSYDFRPGRLSLKLGEPSPEQIVATRTVTYRSPDLVKQERKQAREEAHSKLVQIPETNQLSKARLDDLRKLLRPVAGRPLNDSTRKRLADQVPDLPVDALNWLASAEGLRQFETTVEAAEGLRAEIMAEGVAETLDDLRAAKEKARQRIESKLPLRRPAQSFAAAICAQSLLANRRHLTPEEIAREVQQDVNPARVTGTVSRGQVVIEQGEKVSGEHLAMLKALGLISPGVDPVRVGCLLALVTLGVVLIGTYLRHYVLELYRSPRGLLLLALVTVASMVPMVSQQLRAELVSLLFVTAAAMVVAAVLSPQLAVLVAVVQSVLVGVMGQGDLALTVLTLAGSLAGVSLVRHIWPPSRLFAAVPMLALSVGVAIGALGLLNPALVPDLGHSLLMGTIAGGAAPLLAVGAIFLVQRPFDIASYPRLLELSNPNEPLLKQLAVEAPGTYHSCMMVANLAESAAKAVGADPLLCRVGAYYHDIGKLKRPHFFVENQYLTGAENIHDRLSPTLSRLVITNHVKDGVELARQHRLPSVVRDIIAEHHGTGLISYFYHQAVTGEQSSQVSEEEFRYPGPLPRSKEAALVMLADAVQAAVKSLSEPTPARIEAMINDLIQERLRDGQLDECPLTLRDLPRIAESFRKVLSGVFFHTRIEYPDLIPAEGRRTSGAGAGQESVRGKAGSGPAAPNRPPNGGA